MRECWAVYFTIIPPEATARSFMGAQVRPFCTTHAFTWRSVDDAASHGQGAGAGAGAKRTYGGGSGRGRSAGGGGLSRASIQSLKSGARVLRKYACDAHAIQETVHMSVKLRRKATVSGIQPHERAKR
eukprot:4797853-Pleurochrysis_carterae.AAC.1